METLLSANAKVDSITKKKFRRDSDLERGEKRHVNKTWYTQQELSTKLKE